MLGFPPIRPFPFTKGLSSTHSGAWRPADAWIKALGVGEGAGAGHWVPPPPSERADGDNWAERLTAEGSQAAARAKDAAALADPSVSQALRTRVVAAALSPRSAFAAELKDEIAEMVDDGRLSVDIAAALMRAIDPKDQPQRGEWRVGDTRGGDLAISSPVDDWGVGGTDRWGGGGKGPAMRAIAPPSSAPGYLYPPDGKSRRALTLTKGRKLTRLQRRCQLIATDGPFDTAPDMRAIEKQIAKEFELGLIAA
jgi:hypothetical protein